MEPKSAQKISFLIITLNEEIHMGELLKDLSFADEVIVVDSFSTDKTKAISESFSNVKFIEHRFENYTSQRNFAISQAKNDWVLFLDADERIGSKLKKELLNTIETNVTFTAFLFYRTFMFKDKVLYFSGWQTDKIFRFFNKNYAKYSTDRLVHEKLEVIGKIGTFKNKLLHYSYSDYDSYKRKMISYGKLKAKEKFTKQLRPNLLALIFHPIYNYLYNYIVRLGILDGRKGVIICYLNAYSVYVRYQELYLLWDA